MEKAVRQSDMAQVKTDRVNLRRLRTTDVAKLQQLESDPLVVRFTPAGIPQTESQTRDRLLGQIENQKGWDPFGICFAESKTDGAFLGWFMLLPKSAGELELGFMLVQKYWNQGLTTEICKALIHFAAAHEGISSLMARTAVANEASMHILLKLGFKQAGTIHHFDARLGREIELNKFLYRINSHS